MDSLTIRKPDDWHLHLRDGAMLEVVLPFSTQRFRRAIVMPNLSPTPVKTTEEVRAYKERIEAALHSASFTPLMTYYLTDNSEAADIESGFKEKLTYAVKLYPAGATTNSENGVTDIIKIYPVLETLQKIGMPLLVHGETVARNGVQVDPMDREKVFLDSSLPELLKDFPSLKVVLEHSTTKEAVDFVLNEKSSRLGSTITAHHLLVNREDVKRSEEPAYLHCLPVIKTEADEKALRQAATSGTSYFFLGTDSAPHPISAKERDNPAGGIFTAPSAIELYAQIFDEEGKLDNLEAFASINGAKFYGLPTNEETITLKRERWTIDSLVQVSKGLAAQVDEKIRPFGYDSDPSRRFIFEWKIE